VRINISADAAFILFAGAPDVPAATIALPGFAPDLLGDSKRVPASPAWLPASVLRFCPIARTTVVV
jgi:hypothetical protein